MKDGGAGADPRLEKGRALFNAGRFFEAHDAWEELWREAVGPRRTFLQGLIQIAAGFLKDQRGAPESAARLLEMGLEKLGSGAAPAGALRDFAAAVDDVARLRRGGGAAHRGDPYPLLPPLDGVK